MVVLTEAAAEYFGDSVGGWKNIIFAVNGVKTKVYQMEKAGASIVLEPRVLEWGEWAVVADPDDNKFGVSGPRQEKGHL